MLWPLLLSPVTRYVGAALAVLALVFGVYLYGKSVAREEAREQALIEFTETMERIQDEDADLTDPAVIRRRLCVLADIEPCPLLGD